jgi:hypothetical protein
VPEAVRYQVAAARGLSEDAASFLTGESVEELEHSADALAKLLGAGDDHGDQMTAEADLFRNPPQRRLSGSDGSWPCSLARRHGPVMHRGATRRRAPSTAGLSQPS